ncbi:GspH/FimT family pseudopilin [Desulfogranum japonicum]|uniref:GspH/FimT family pseudopilin n=1 Tax=Desulfogranum japonicum TaxID=231447 RepID=UPI0013790B31|nr:GspH/FimT family pseudopilin [Desulfogranum japonicum]
MKKANTSGFTTVELMVVVAIIGIALAIATPALMAYMPNMQLKGAARSLYMALMQAKSEAVRRNVNCVLTFNQAVNGDTYTYVVYQDDNGDFTFDPGEQPIVLAGPLPSKVSITNNNLGANADGKKTIVFQPNTLPSIPGSWSNGTIEFTSSQGTVTSVVVNKSGNVRIKL